MRRCKTNKVVPLAVELTPFASLLLGYVLGMRHSTDRLIGMRIEHIRTQGTNRALREVIKTANEARCYAKIEDYTAIGQWCTLYTARHTFASIYIHNGGDIVSLAKLMGRAVDGIHIYTQALDTDIDLALHAGGLTDV